MHHRIPLPDHWCLSIANMNYGLGLSDRTAAGGIGGSLSCYLLREGHRVWSVQISSQATNHYLFFRSLIDVNATELKFTLKWYLLRRLAPSTDWQRLLCNCRYDLQDYCSVSATGCGRQSLTAYLFSWQWWSMYLLVGITGTFLVGTRRSNIYWNIEMAGWLSILNPHAR